MGLLRAARTVITNWQLGVMIRLTKRFSWTGYTKPMASWLNLLDAVHTSFSSLLGPEYHTSPETTYCNVFVSEVCQLLGFREFNGKLANQIVDLVQTHPQWTEVEMENAQERANEGSLVIAGLKAEPHGHVVVLVPGKMKVSGRWGMVPACANVGRTYSIGRGINWSFRDKPKFWLWRHTL